MIIDFCLKNKLFSLFQVSKVYQSIIFLFLELHLHICLREKTKVLLYIPIEFLHKRIDANNNFFTATNGAAIDINVRASR